MARSNIDRLKKFSELSNDYWQKFREDKNDYYNTAEAQEARNELNKRHVELKDLIAEAEGMTPAVSLFGGQPVDLFRTAFNSSNSTAAFHAMKNVPDILARTIAFHGNKKAVSEPKKVSGRTAYINPEIIEGFESKEGPFNYRKLIKLLKQLNDNYERGNEHSCSQLIKAILNHIPPLLGYETFNSLASSYKWSSDAHKKYAARLNEWITVAHSGTHSLVSASNDLFTTEDLPLPIYLNEVLEECRVNTVTEIPSFKKSATPVVTKPKPADTNQSVSVTVKEQMLKWANWSEYGPSFNGHITLNNFNNDKPNYLNQVFVSGTNGNGRPYKGENFKVRLGRDTVQRLKVDANEIVDCEVFVSHSNLTNDVSQWIDKEMPDLDRDTVKLVLEFADGQSQEASVHITRG